MTPAAHVRRNIAISTAMNGAVRAGSCWLVLGGLAVVTVRSAGSLLVGYLPRGFMTGLTSAIVPGLLAHEARAAGRIGQVDRRRARSAPCRAVHRSS